jgi:hypothetical protein
VRIKRIVDNRMKDYGDEDDRTHVIRVNKALSKKDPGRKTPVNPHASRYPGVLDTEVHEEMHAANPKLTEKQVWKRTRKLMTTMKPAAKKKVYSRFR